MTDKPDMVEDVARAKRGFAALSPERRREIAARGGASVPKEKRSFSRTTDLASQAGRKGGLKVPADKRSFSTNENLAREAGRKGGLAAQRRRPATPVTTEGGT